jgi:hypothetical protein
MVRAKFKCESVSPTINDSEEGLANIKLSAVIDGSEENKEFFRWTPSGQLILSCVNPNVNKQFEVGKEYYIDISPA